MALSIFVFITLLKLALSLPEPDPNVKVVVDVEVDDRGCGCCNNEKCCAFDGVKYRSGYNLVAGCAELCCNRNGEWEFKGIDKDCEYCMVGGEPWVIPFGYPTTQAYNTWTSGEYVLSQLGVSKANPQFGVIGDFVTNTYVKGVTYYENFHSDKISISCLKPGGMQDFECNILKNSILNFREGNCIIIVGKKITVKMCPNIPNVPMPPATTNFHLPWVYIYAPPSLCSLWPGELYGLCNTYTSDRSIGYYASNGTIYTTPPTTNPNDPFVESWKYP